MWSQWSAALDTKPDFVDPSLSWAQQSFEHAKLVAAKARLSPLPPARGRPALMPAPTGEAAAAAAAAPSGVVAVSSPPPPPPTTTVTSKASAAEVDAAFSAAAARFRSTLCILTGGSVAAAPDGGAAGAEREAPQAVNVRILLGNCLFEHSQLVHARGGPKEEWGALMDEAVASFNAAGCSQADISRALASHGGASADGAAKAIEAPATPA